MQYKNRVRSQSGTPCSEGDTPTARQQLTMIVELPLQNHHHWAFPYAYSWETSQQRNPTEFTRTMKIRIMNPRACMTMGACEFLQASCISMRHSMHFHEKIIVISV